ncbi:hypothetical protein A2197_01290, partial [Candidatus Woesebacteria bacterium RIFOXYA1_FULL_48_16]
MTGTFVSVRLEDILIAFVLFILSVTRLSSLKNLFRLPVTRAVILFLGIGFISSFSGIFLTKTASLNLGLLHAFRRVEYFSLFFVAYFALQKIKDLGLIIRIIILTSFLVSVYGLGQQFFNFPVVSTTNSEFSKGLALTLGAGARINSTFAGHYDLAAYLIFPLLLIIAIFPLSRYRWLLAIVAFLAFWTMLLSASRITFASFFMAAFLLILFIRRYTWMPLLVAAAVFGVLVSPQLRGRYLELITNHLNFSWVAPVSAQTGSKDVNSVPDALKPPAAPEDRSFNIRIKAEWPKALRAFYKNPVLGTGYSSVGLAVDNDYLRALAETGILGFLAFALIFIRFFKTSLPYILHPSPRLPDMFILAVTCSVVGLLINAVFIDVFAASKIAISTWAMVGLAE